MRIRGLCKLHDWGGLTGGKRGLVLVSKAMLSNSLIQYSVDGLGSLPVCPDYGGGSEDNGNLLQRSHACSAALSTPNPSRPPLAHASSRDSWTLVGKSESVSFVVTAPIFWVLVCTRFCLCPPRVCFPVLCKFLWLYGGVNGNLLREGLCL